MRDHTCHIIYYLCFVNLGNSSNLYCNMCQTVIGSTTVLNCKISTPTDIPALTGRIHAPRTLNLLLPGTVLQAARSVIAVRAKAQYKYLLKEQFLSLQMFYIGSFE